MSTLASALIEAGHEAAADLRSRIAAVCWAPVDSGYDIAFTLDGQPHLGRLRGRNQDLLIGWGNDEAIAARVLLDGDSTLAA